MCVENKDRLLNALRVISRGFVWRDTPQGRDYWHNVHQKLLRYCGLEEGTISSYFIPGEIDNRGVWQNLYVLAAVELNLGLHWSATAEGSSYWREVYLNLEHLGRNEEMPPQVEKEIEVEFKE